MGFFSFLGGGGGSKSAPSVPNTPVYQPSKYDAPSSETLFNFWEPRVRGEKLGLSDEGLRSLKAQAVDVYGRQTDELSRRALSGAKSSGLITTGGANRLRMGAIQSGLEARSAAIRDVGIKNEILKHDDQYASASGLQNFLNAERSEAHNIFADDVRSYGLDTDYYSAMYGAEASEPSIWSKLSEFGGNLFTRAAMDKFMGNSSSSGIDSKSAQNAALQNLIARATKATDKPSGLQDYRLTGYLK